MYLLRSGGGGAGRRRFVTRKTTASFQRSTAGSHTNVAMNEPNEQNKWVNERNAHQNVLQLIHLNSPDTLVPSQQHALNALKVINAIYYIVIYCTYNLTNIKRNTG